MSTPRYKIFVASVALATLAVAAAAHAQPYGPGMMGWGYGYGPGRLIVCAVILIAVVAGVVWLVRSRYGNASRRLAGLDVLEERYARGEINRDEYLEKKKDMLG